MLGTLGLSRCSGKLAVREHHRLLSPPWASPGGWLFMPPQPGVQAPEMTGEDPGLVPPHPPGLLALCPCGVSPPPAAKAACTMSFHSLGGLGQASPERRGGSGAVLALWEGDPFSWACPPGEPVSHTTANKAAGGPC